MTDPELRAFAEDEEGELGSDEEAASSEERVDDDAGSDAGYDSKSTTAPYRLWEPSADAWNLTGLCSSHPYLSGRSPYLALVPLPNGERQDRLWLASMHPLPLKAAQEHRHGQDPPHIQGALLSLPLPLAPARLIVHLLLVSCQVHVRSLARFEAFLVENPQDDDVDPRLIVDLLLDGMTEASRKAEEEAEERVRRFHSSTLSLTTCPTDSLPTIFTTPLLRCRK